jgi:class 3 adenylate cyclase
MRRRGGGADRLLATVMFTDIVGSTELASQLGDRGWKALVARHNSIVRRELKRFAGRELDTAGDGFFVMFERPAQAIDCAWAIIDALRPLKLQIRAAIHMGEVEVMGGKVGGIAVHAASRVLSLARPGQIYVTGIVHDVVAGSDIRFADEGVHELRGVPGEWRLFAVEEAATDRALPIEEVPDPTTVRRRAWAPLAVAVGAGGLIAVAAIAFVLANARSAPPIVARPNTVVRINAGDGMATAVHDVQGPTGVAIDGGAAWVLSLTGRTVTRIDEATGATASVGLPAAPTGIATGGGSLWVTTGFGSVGGSAGVLRIGQTSLSVEETIALGEGVAGVAVGEGGVWVTNRILNSLTRIDLATRTVGGELDVGQQPEAVAVGEGSVWVANSIDKTIWRIEPGGMTKSTEITLADPPHDLAVGFGRLWVTSSLGNSVTIIDLASGTIQRKLDMPGPARGVATSNGAVWVALNSGALVEIEPDDPTAFTELELPGAPEGVAVSGDSVWVSIRE